MGQDHQALGATPAGSTLALTKQGGGASAVHRTAIAFENRRGLQLVGVLERPRERVPSEVGILMLSPGIKMRVGPERLYRRMSEAFVGIGYTVFRFDYYGLGDSEGVLSESALKQVYSHIEMGRYVDDACDAMDWLQREHGLKRFVAFGLCGGAVTGILAGSRDRRIEGALALSITPVLSTATDDVSRYMTAGQLASLRERYVRKLANPKAWLRALTLKSDFKAIWRSALKPWIRRSEAGVARASTPAHDNASPLFPPAFFAMAESARPMLLLFGGSDRLHFEFEEKFAARYRERLASVSTRYEVHVIPHANHVYTFDAWQREVVDRACEWLLRRFPVGARAGLSLVSAD